MSDTTYLLVPLNGYVLFPGTTTVLLVGRAPSKQAIERLRDSDQTRLVFATHKKKDATQPIHTEDLYRTGTLAKVIQFATTKKNDYLITVRGLQRVRISDIRFEDGVFHADARVLRERRSDEGEIDTLINLLTDNLKELAKHDPQVQKGEVLEKAQRYMERGDVSRFVHHLAGILPQGDYTQQLLEKDSLSERLEQLLVAMRAHLEMLNIERRIEHNVSEQIEKGQREYIINEKIKALRNEIGNGQNFNQLRDRVTEAHMSEEAEKKSLAEIERMEQLPASSPELHVSHTYVETLIKLPWHKKSKLSHDLKSAKAILDGDHYGLGDVKDRVLEYIAVSQRVDTAKSPILCFVGPPGVGKTSLAQSIARATNRKFVKMSLGGVRDEGEIRGHRRTYVGAMPGRIIGNMIRADEINPLFLLDEIDKLSFSMQGDPASALLEVLDPEQNSKFLDHYLDVEYDLSNVLFLATANSYNLLPALLDRLEIIPLSGYIEQEKFEIARRHIINRAYETHGVKRNELRLSDSALLDMIRFYTAEAGVRELERQINKVFRKSVRRLSEDGELKSISVHARNLDDFLGVHKYRHEKGEKKGRIGRVNGLAWTEVGGELLKVEVATVPGKGNLVSTGKLGEVMQESVKTALTVVRARADTYGIKTAFYENCDIHVHFPAGAVPKDGPSAGIAITTALISALNNKRVRSDVAMTGEISLHGRVLPIGGLKEKLIAARRASMKTVIIPDDNRQDLQEIPDLVKNGLNICPVKRIEDVVALALA